ncbi:hypothetical protein PUN28_000060 [Cardiocondyla obscurior]|uniref:Uncharacterized protein n=1 Tax=Cardiocondyla obscurior TaxID=286306 RepID=A0AAW2GXY7_9HYME
MTRKVYEILLIVALSASLGASAPDWGDELGRNIEEQVHQFTTNLQSQIQNSLRPVFADIDKTIQNLPKDSQGVLISNGRVITNGNTVITNTVNGLTKMIMSGRNNDGEPYVRTIEERNDGGYLDHYEINVNPRTNSTEKIHWRLDLATPGAKPEIIND